MTIDWPRLPDDWVEAIFLAVSSLYRSADPAELSGAALLCGLRARHHDLVAACGVMLNCLAACSIASRSYSASNRKNPFQLRALGWDARTLADHAHDGA
jgi:hypothetical protein